MNENTNKEEEVTEQWHLDKRVPLSLIVTMIVQVGAVIWAIADIKKDVEVLKVQVNSQHDRDAQQDKVVNDSTSSISARLEKIDNKLDRLIESWKGQRK